MRTTDIICAICIRRFLGLDTMWGAKALQIHNSILRLICSPHLDDPDSPPRPGCAHASVVKEALESLEMRLRLIQNVERVGLLSPFLQSMTASTTFIPH